MSAEADNEDQAPVDIKGPPLRPDTLSYFRQIESVLEKNEFQDEEEVAALISNVHKETYGKEYRLAVNKHCSQVLERVIAKSTPLQVRAFFHHIAQKLFPLCTDRHGSHVVEAVLKRVPAILIEETRRLALGEDAPEEKASEDEPEISNIPPMKKLMKVAAKELKPTWTTLACDTYGSHIVRAFIAVLSGFTDIKQASQQGSAPFRQEAKQEQARDTDHLTGLGHILPNISASLTECDDSTLERLESNAFGGLVLQSLLDGLAAAEDEVPLARLCARLLGWPVDQPDQWASAPSDRLWALVTDRAGSRLMEKIVACAPSGVLTAAQSLLLQSARDAAFDPFANFVLQRILDRISDLSAADAAFESLKELLPELIQGRRAGVVLALINACIRTEARIKELPTTLSRAVGVKNPSENKKTVELLLAAEGAGDGKGRKSKYSLQGSLIVQALLTLPADICRIVFDSFTAMSAEYITQLATDPTGSRVVEAFLKGSASPKVKGTFISKLLGKFAQLAGDSSGSFVIEHCFQASDIKQKTKIAQELVKAEQRLGSTRSGKLLWRKFQLEGFKRSKSDWASSVERKKRSDAASFLEDIGAVDRAESKESKEEAKGPAHKEPSQKKKRSREAEQPDDAPQEEPVENQKEVAPEAAPPHTKRQKPSKSKSQHTSVSISVGH